MLTLRVNAGCRVAYIVYGYIHGTVICILFNANRPQAYFLAFNPGLLRPILLLPSPARMRSCAFSYSASKLGGITKTWIRTATKSGEIKRQKGKARAAISIRPQA